LLTKPKKKNSNSANILNNFNGQLPIPIRLSKYYSAEQFPTLVDLLDDNILLDDFCEKMEKQIKEAKKEGKECPKCGWHYASKTDSEGHKTFCKKVRNQS